ncbi:hypothetical protein AX15_003975 [Amanita polypyramis BW_CC]|nr:hypothetical protein AX15_003975 [Amanita polypyramis BW_CC]
MSPKWGAPLAEEQLRLTSQRLRQLQDRKNAHSSNLRRNIAKLLRQRNIWLARARVQDLLVEESFIDLLERLQMYIGVLLEHFNELDLKSPLLSAEVLEAMATIVHVASHVESQELQVVRDLLVNHLGSNCVSSAMNKPGNHVSPVVIRALVPSTPSAIEINACLQEIVSGHNVPWELEPTRHDLARPLSGVLTGSSPLIDMSALRQLCRYGIPDDPVWLRPRIWKLLLGIISPKKETWPTELSKRRNDYYDLVRQLLDRFSAPETSSLSSSDASLLDISKQLFRIPSNLFIQLENAPDISSFCPLDANAPDNIKIPCANNLELRLSMLQDEQQESIPMATPEARTEMDASVEGNASGNPDITSQESRSTVWSSKAFGLSFVQPRHLSALLRILYVHATINPGILSPHVPSLLVPLYTVLTQEVEPEESAHTEADAFWLFEAMLGEFNEFEDEQATNKWLHKFGERVAWVDRDFFNFLQTEGLDPSLPHYSYRWLATLLTHTLPLSSIIPVWDVLFSCPMRTQSADYKMDRLVDVCTAMLLCLRSELFRLGGSSTSAHLSPSERDNIKMQYHPKSNDTFMEGMATLQNYRVGAAGGIDRILQTASDLLQHRLNDYEDLKKKEFGLGDRIRDTMWRGFTNQLVSPAESSPESSDHDNELPQVEKNEVEILSRNGPPSFTSRLVTTVWKGITNQTAMESPPSPPVPSTPTSHSPVLPPKDLPRDGAQRSPDSYNSIWNYAEKLKDSDAVASLSKFSSNWRAKALVATWGQRYQTSQDWDTVEQSNPSRYSGLHHLDPNALSSSLSSSVYSPPLHPAYFHSPHDDYISSETEIPSSYHSNISTSQSAPSTGIISKTGASLAAFLRSVPPTPKSAPRPLLLSSTSLVATTSQGSLLSRSPHSAPILDHHGRAEYLKFRRTNVHRDSLSSVSSVPTPEAMVQPNRASASDKDSDTSGPSRRVLLNRKSVSPLALKYRSQRSTNYSRSSSITSSDAGQESSHEVPQRPSTNTGVQRRMSDSSPFASPPVPYTPSSAETPFNNAFYVNEYGGHRDPALLEDWEEQMLVSTSTSKRPLRKKVLTENGLADNTSDSPTARLPTRNARVRTRKNQLTNLPLGDLPTLDTLNKAPSPDTLKVDWLEDQDTSTTPRASEFDLNSQQSISPRSTKYSRKISTEKKTSVDGREIRIRKTSNSQRTRKTSENREEVRNSRDSAAEEGDDEGYDDLLSAYESEEGPQSLDRT